MERGLPLEGRHLLHISVPTKASILTMMRFSSRIQHTTSKWEAKADFFFPVSLSLSLGLTHNRILGTTFLGEEHSRNGSDEKCCRNQEGGGGSTSCSGKGPLAGAGGSRPRVLAFLAAGANKTNEAVEQKLESIDSSLQEVPFPRNTQQKYQKDTPKAIGKS